MAESQQGINPYRGSNLCRDGLDRSHHKHFSLGCYLQEQVECQEIHRILSAQWNMARHLSLPHRLLLLRTIQVNPPKR